MARGWYNKTDMDLNKQIDCFLLDLDGTVYLGSKLIDGVKEGIERMRNKNKRVIFLTNNSSTTKAHYVKKISSLGIPVTMDDIYTSANATADWIKENRKDCKPYIVATPETEKEFVENGISSCNENPDTVILTFDKTLDYSKLVRCCDLIARGAEYIATHPDMVCPMENGSIPDIGSFINLIEGTTHRRPDVICGKPYKIMADCISKKTGIPLGRTAMIGDRLSTDMKFAIDNGLVSVLTLSGEANMTEYEKSGLTVNKIINSVAEWDV